MFNNSCQTNSQQFLSNIFSTIILKRQILNNYCQKNSQQFLLNKFSPILVQKFSKVLVKQIFNNYCLKNSKQFLTKKNFCNFCQKNSQQFLSRKSSNLDFLYKSILYFIFLKNEDQIIANSSKTGAKTFGNNPQQHRLHFLSLVICWPSSDH